MSAVERAIAWMELEKRCCGPRGHCLKCDGALQQRFDAADGAIVRFLADTLCSCSVEDLEANAPLLWLVALLNGSDYERFVAGLAKLAPYSGAFAWRLILLSAHNKGNWCFSLRGERRAGFRPKFHLHPALAPALLVATMRPESELEDALKLCEFFEPVAASYPVLGRALPLWRAELQRREEQAKAQWLREREVARVESVRRSAERAARELEFRAVEAGGPLAVVNVILRARRLDGDCCAERWAGMSERDLAVMPRELLEGVLVKIGESPVSRRWRGFQRRISHLLSSKAHAADRQACLSGLVGKTLVERLGEACLSRWSMTYFPEEWAEQLVEDASALPPDLRASVLAKVSRVSRKGAWRAVRRILERSGS